MQTMVFRFEGIAPSSAAVAESNNSDASEAHIGGIEEEFTKLWNAHREIAASGAKLRTEAAKYSKTTNDILRSILARLERHDLYFDKLVLNRDKMPRRVF